MKTSLLIPLFLILACSPKEKQIEAAVKGVKINSKTTSTVELNEETKRYTLPGLDHGLVQSPINILSFAAGENGKHQITTHFEDKINAIENTGHSVQLDFAPGSTITVDNETFDFQQMHFHTPSEHLIDGMTFPMELHIVNTMKKLSPSDTTEYLVIGILFKMGKEDNKFIEEFINSIPTKSHSKVKIKTGTVRLEDLLETAEDSVRTHYYNYRGSLTTPPNTESVRWYIYKHIFEASPRQIQRINELEGNNARHVQAMFGRKVDID
jgi:carbonic anhydrase